VSPQAGGWREKWYTESNDSLSSFKRLNFMFVVFILYCFQVRHEANTKHATVMGCEGYRTFPEANLQEIGKPLKSCGIQRPAKFDS
jgi:hypothetical protein